MKECEKYAALLDAFSEGDLFLEDMVQVQTHLMNCPGCQAYLEDLLAMRAAFPSVEDTEVPEGFADRVMAAVAEHPRAAAPTSTPKAKKTPWRKLLVPLAACCALVILLGRTAIGGSNAPTAKFSAQAETAVTEECAIEEPMAREAAPAETAAGSLTADAVETQETAAYDGAMAETESFSYTSDTKSEVTEAAPEAAEAPPLRDGTEFLLTAEEAGTLLQNFTPAAETETEALYLLSARDYISLLTALPREVRQSAPASTAETMRVVVLK